MKDFWQKCVQSLAQGLPAEQVKIWVDPLQPLEFNEAAGELRISAPNPMKQNWAKTNYTAKIQSLASEYFNRSGIKVLFVVESRSPRRMMTASSDANTNTNTKAVATLESNQAPVPKVEVSTINTNSHPSAPTVHSPDNNTEVANPSRVDREMNFENLVVGKSNQFAVAAAEQVVNFPGGSGFNPFYLYGSTGLGKTHLMHAIGNRLLLSGQSTKVRYIHAEQFFSDMVGAIKRGNLDTFKHFYQSLDLLLIDDIQFLKNKEATQDLLFYVYEAMVARNKQIIITSDTYPKELKDINDRLRSRFSSGLTVSIEPPPLEMRVAILHRKAELKHPHLTLTEEAAFFVAKHIRSNVRELEGALSKISAFAGFNRCNELTVDVCKQALKDLLSVSIGQITIENIQKTVAEFYKISIKDMHSKRRPTNIALPRQIAMYLAKELTQKSLPEIGDSFGGRDHTTVLHAVRKITEARGKNNELNHQLHILEQTLKG